MTEWNLWPLFPDKGVSSHEPFMHWHKFTNLSHIWVNVCKLSWIVPKTGQRAFSIKTCPSCSHVKQVINGAIHTQFCRCEWLMKLGKANGRYYASDSICCVSNIRVTRETYLLLLPWKICCFFNIEDEKIIGEKTYGLFLHKYELCRQ